MSRRLTEQEQDDFIRDVWEDKYHDARACGMSEDAATTLANRCAADMEKRRAQMFYCGYGSD